MDVKVSQLGLALSVLEFWPYIPSLIFTLICYVCVIRCRIMTRCLRLLLCLMLLRTPISIVRRTLVLIQRVFYTGEGALLPHQELNNGVLFYTWYLICFSMILLCLERLLSTFFRKATAKIVDHPATSTLIVLIVLFASFCPAYWNLHLPTRHVQIVTFFLTTPILIVLYRTNRRWRLTKLEKSLATKCAFEANMLGIRAVLPFLVHVNICSFFTLMVIQYQERTSPFALGYDMGIMNNVYGLLNAWEALLSPMLILHNFYRVHRRGVTLRNRCAAHRDADAERLAHFNCLRVSWNSPAPRAEERRTRSNPEIYTVQTSEV